MDVSIVIPCRNEEFYIEGCLRSVERNCSPEFEMEILVVDGMSTDRTRAIVGRLAAEFGNIRLLDNPGLLTPKGLNIGVRAARGRYIMRMDAHAEIAPDYVARCLKAMKEHPADNVGGPMRTLPRDITLMGRAIIAGLSHRFGVGNSHFRTGSSEARYVDTVFGGFYRREVFERIGYFNEDLPRGQDIEFNLRLKAAGGRTLLVPGVDSTYYARSDYRSFLPHNFTNGKWVVLAFDRSDVVPVSLRHLIPLFFVLSLLGCASLCWLEPIQWLGLGVAGAYLAACSAASASVARREREWRMFLPMMACFAGLHVSYGCGSLAGAIHLLRDRMRRWLGSMTQKEDPSASGRLEPFRFYGLQPSRYEFRGAVLPPEYEVSCWAPSIWEFSPRGTESLLGRRTLLLWWLYDRLTSRGAGYRICLIRRAGRVVHYSAVFGKNPRFPFMGERDLQVGPVWTAGSERRRGLQRAALDTIVRELGGAADTVWWLCRESNAASNIVAQRAGFELRGTGRRRPRFGLWLAGSFQLEHA